MSFIQKGKKDIGVCNYTDIVLLKSLITTLMGLNFGGIKFLGSRPQTFDILAGI